MSLADVATRPLGPGDLSELAALFGGTRNTRHCWCTAFCTTRSQFAVGWLAALNQRRFESMARGSVAPMGVLASVSGEPVAWGACGPRARYRVAENGRSRILRDRDRDEDADVWLLACMFVRDDLRGVGLTSMLVRAAVALARSEGAVAIEGWPVTDDRGADAFVGREEVFRDLGFHRVERPTPHRSIVRLELR